MISKKTWLQRQNCLGSHAHVWDPAPQILAANRQTIVAKECSQSQSPFRNHATTSSVAKHVQEDDLFERLGQALRSGRDINFLEVKRNVYTVPLHISICLWIDQKRYCDIVLVTMIFHPSFCFGSLFICMNNSIPKKAAKISMPKLCVCIICSSQSFKLSNLLLILELSVTKSYTLDLVDLNDVPQRRCRGDSLLYCPYISTYGALQQLFLLKTGVCSTHQWSQPCLLGLRHLFIRYLHKRGLVT